MKFEAASARSCVKIRVLVLKTVIVRISETSSIRRLDSTAERKFTTLVNYFNVVPSTWRRNNFRGRVGHGFHVDDDVLLIKMGGFGF